MAIRVLVVDDSAFMRHALSRLLSEAGGIEIVGAASNGEQGLEMVRTLRPDVVTLDVEMPVLGGLGMLRQVMAEQPTRVIMLSSLTTDGARVTLDALHAGAIDFVAKPDGSLSVDIGRVGSELVAKVRAAATMSEAAWLAFRMRAGRTGGLPTHDGPQTSSRPNGMSSPAGARGVGPAGPAGSVRGVGAGAVAPLQRQAVPAVSHMLVVVASSTGGPAALHNLVAGLPNPLGAGVLIVQHLPVGFSASLASRLSSVGRLPVIEAASGDSIGLDRIALAPGDDHLISSISGRIQLVGLPSVHGVRPAADVTLQSVAPVWRERLLFVVLTGMGVDGRDGARAVREHGGTVFAQDEATSTIFGMPAAVIDDGLADRVLPLDRMAAAIAAWCATGSVSASLADRHATATPSMHDARVRAR
jgi:two-component system chemotaxis response regulator CheB